jgi:hypothetical protein
MSFISATAPAKGHEKSPAHLNGVQGYPVDVCQFSGSTQGGTVQADDL